MNQERHDKAIEIMKMIQDDIASDVENMEGAEFTRRNVSEWIAHLAAAVSSLAKTCQLILEGEI